ncbi:MAG: hypothetical protein EPN98_21440 [Phenylobacterium sp.]|uniref:phage protease n=1 Tax=Phenylobacterium sp. TaxID=1871053 RepID=UPI00122254D7|nr:phage protease [Phenylobacterium sp.]TAL29009.1 MAG: hypothetical protein EPN98_21440 [Phenylobacterium sp.]
MKGRQSLRNSQTSALTSAYSTTFDPPAEGQPVVAPSEFRVFRAGINQSSKGDFLFDDDAAKSVMAAFAKKGTPPTMDYEHQALAQPPVEAPASCSSWIPEVRNGELWATSCNWTDRARRMIEAREYTRFSPAFLHDIETMRILVVLNVALTNVEALDNVQPLVAATAAATATATDPGVTPMKPMACKQCSVSLKAPTDDDDGDEMYCKTCKSASTTRASMLTLVGLTATAPDNVVAVELSAIASFNGEILRTTGKASRAEALGVIEGWKANATEVVMLRAAEVSRESARIKAEFDAAISGAIEAGKVPPAEKDALILFAGTPNAENLARLTAYLATKAVVVPRGETRSPAGGGATGDVITPEDIQMAKLTANPAQTIEDVRKFKLAQLGRASA